MYCSSASEVKEVEVFRNECGGASEGKTFIGCFTDKMKEHGYELVTKMSGDGFFLFSGKDSDQQNIKNLRI